MAGKSDNEAEESLVPTTMPWDPTPRCSSHFICYLGTLYNALQTVFFKIKGQLICQRSIKEEEKRQSTAAWSPPPNSRIYLYGKGCSKRPPGHQKEHLSRHNKLECKAEDGSQQSKGSKILRPALHTSLGVTGGVPFKVHHTTDVVQQSSNCSSDREANTSEDQHRVEGDQVFKRVLVGTLDTIELVGVLVAGLGIESGVRNIECFASFHDSSGHVSMLQERENRVRKHVEVYGRRPINQKNN
jgi:hypothetical protein